MSMLLGPHNEASDLAGRRAKTLLKGSETCPFIRSSAGRIGALSSFWLIGRACEISIRALAMKMPLGHMPVARAGTVLCEAHRV